LNFGVDVAALLFVKNLFVGPRVKLFKKFSLMILLFLFNYKYFDHLGSTQLEYSYVKTCFREIHCLDFVTFICMHVCMCACMYVYMYACVHVCMYV
jgi:hypothetical protein